MSTVQTTLSLEGPGKWSGPSWPTLENPKTKQYTLLYVQS